jgi:Ras of Complex, Roc, domain of DAPkinase/Leucine rich repeat/Leucine Rich repeat
MNGETDDADAATSPFRIPVLDAAEFQEQLDRAARAKKPQLHLLGPEPRWDDEAIWDALFRVHGKDLDRKNVFRVAETPDLASWAETVSLQALSLMGCGVQDDDCDLLGKIVGLTSLNLWDNQIGVEGAKAIAQQLPGLTSLHLWHNQIGDEGAKAIAQELSGLTFLNLWENQIGVNGAKEIAERLSRLTSLHLWHNQIGDEGAKAIAQELSGLTSLDLGSNKIGDEGAKAIAQELSGLTSLHLWHNQIGVEGAKAIAQQLSGLTFLNLGNNKIGDEGAKAIAQRLSGLTSLDLEHNQIGDDGVCALVNLLQSRQFQLLRTLNLEGNNIRCVDGPLLATRDAKMIFEAVLKGVALPHARIMLVGMEGVGKSLLARRTFLDCVQLEGPHDKTHDITVLRPEECQWMPRIEPERDQPQVQTWVWDFAGQLVTHGVHESFLADDGRTVYVVVLAADREPDRASVKYDGNRLRYWLQMLRYTVGSVAPVIIVSSRNDKWKGRQGTKPVDSFLDWPEVTPNRALKDVELDELSNRLNVSVINVVTDFSACDDTYPIREGLQRVIQDAVLQLGVVKEKRVPRGFVPLKNLMDDRFPKHTLIARTEFDDWCAEVEIEGATLRDELLRMLHHMGSLIYWGRTKSDQPPQRDHYEREDQRLTWTHRAPPGSLQTSVLNPKWFKTCVYAITQASEELDEGKPRVWLTASEIDRIVSQASAGLAPSSATHPVEGTVIREALRFIGVCWEDEDSGEFLFPRGLPERDWGEYLAWGGHRLTWDFLPEHCVAKLLVRLHQERLVVSPKKGIYVHDRNTALITYPRKSGNRALVSAVPEQGHVEIRYSKETQPDQRQSALQHLLAILEAPELQGRSPVISQIGPENTQTQQPPIRTTGLQSVREAELQSSATNPVVWGSADHAPPPPAAKEWKGTLLGKPNPMVVIDHKVLSKFYEVGLCYEKLAPTSQKDVADGFNVRESTVSRWEDAMRELLNEKFPDSTKDPLVTREKPGGPKTRLSAVGIEAMAWIEYCLPSLLDLRKSIPG